MNTRYDLTIASKTVEEFIKRANGEVRDIPCLIVSYMANFIVYMKDDEEIAEIIQSIAIATKEEEVRGGLMAMFMMASAKASADLLRHTHIAVMNKETAH